VATTVVIDDDDTDSPLQLVSSGFPSSPTGASAPAADLDGDGVPDPSAGRVYRIALPPAQLTEPGELHLTLSYAPKSTEETTFGLPLTLTGVPRSKALSRVVYGRGLKPRLLVSTKSVVMGERILREPTLPYTSELTLSSADGAPLEWEFDDVLVIEAALNKTSAVSFKLANSFDAEAPFTAYFTPDSPTVFSVSPVAGVLPPAGTPGTLLTVAYSPIEYGKLVRGTLVILTEDMQWSYEVRGAHPVYEVPQVSGSRVDHTLRPELTQRLGTVTKKNYLQSNAEAVQRSSTNVGR